MLPEHIISILNKYNSEIMEEISSINLAITRISDALSTVNSVLINELSAYARNTGINNIEKEKELWKDSFELKKYISSITLVKNHPQNKIIQKETPSTLDIFSVLVLNNTRKCSYKDQMPLTL